VRLLQQGLGLGPPAPEPADVVARSNVLWIGGPPRSGKTTVATRVARRHGLRWYNADAHTWAHRDRAIAAGHPGAIRWEAMTPDERWVTTTPERMLELSIDLERWPMIVDDLSRLPATPLIVAEGSTVPPDLVAQGIADPTRAVWLLPTPELQRERLGAPRGVSDPDRARENLAGLYALIGAEIERQAAEHGVHVLHVDGSLAVDETVAAVEELFAEPLAEGPRAETREERAALTRYANEVLVAQFEAYFARPWTTGTTKATSLPFACECGDPDCEAVVELAVVVFPADEPVLAEGHATTSATEWE